MPISNRYRRFSFPLLVLCPALLRLSHLRQPSPAHSGVYHCFCELSCACASMPTSATQPLYQPVDVSNTAVFHFMETVNTTSSLNLSSYYDLYKWSISNVDTFWDKVWDHVAVIGTRSNHVVDKTALPSTNPPWFGLQLRCSFSPFEFPTGSRVHQSTGPKTCCAVVPEISSR